MYIKETFYKAHAPARRTVARASSACHHGNRLRQVCSRIRGPRQDSVSQVTYLRKEGTQSGEALRPIPGDEDWALNTPGNH